MNASVDTIPCCVCGAMTTRPWRVAKDNLMGGETLFTAVRCTRCGTARLQPRPPAEEMGRYYTPETYARAEGEGELAHRLDTFFDQQAQRVVEAMKLREPHTPGRLLDVGCGDGRFLAAMQKRGWTTTGIETDAVAADLARNRTHGTVYETPLEATDFADASFDLVSLLHVLEHVPDPRATLKTAVRVLRPGGTLLLALPNAGSLESQLFGSNWYPLDLPRHYWGFSPRTLARLVEECGFRHPRLRYLPWMFAPQSLRYVARALRRRPTPLAHRAETPEAESGWKTRFFLGLLSASQRIGRFLPGEVMELTAVKPSDLSPPPPSPGRSFLAGRGGQGGEVEPVNSSTGASD